MLLNNNATNVLHAHHHCERQAPRVRRRGAIASLLTLVATVSCLLAASAAQAKVIYVDLFAPPPGDGMSWETAFTDLQDGLSAAVYGDEIWVAGKDLNTDNNLLTPAYKPAPPYGSRTATFQLKNGVKLYGGFRGWEDRPGQREFGMCVSVLSGDLNGNDSDDQFTDNSYHVVATEGLNQTTLIDGFHIWCGRADGSAPANYGGGLYCSNSYLTIQHCTFNINYAAGGAGGLSLTGSSPRVINCNFHGNEAVGGGAAMFLADASDPTVINTTFLSNRHTGGNGEAGGVYIGNGCAPHFVNCTFSGNTSTQHYGAVFSHPGNDNPDNPTVLVNCIVWGSQPSAIGEGQFDVRACDLEDAIPGWWVFSEDPMFLNPPDDVQLQDGSPCIDYGDTDAYVAYDGPLGDGSVIRTRDSGRFVDDPNVTTYHRGIPGCLDLGAIEKQSSQSTCPQDVNNDGTVDIDDVFAVLAGWGDCQ